MKSSEQDHGLDKSIAISGDQLTIGNLLGRGKFGIVYEANWAINRVTKWKVAVKELLVEEYTADIVSAFKREVGAHVELDHPNIVKLYGITIKQPYYMVMEYMKNNSLDIFLRTFENPKLLSWKIRISMANDMAAGLAYLHNMHPPILHRDLKSLNVLIGDGNVAKLSDFGLAKVKLLTQSQNKTHSKIKKEVVGSFLWLAPEIHDGVADNSEATDVYALGWVLWELCSHQFPYQHMHGKPDQVIIRQIVTNKRGEFSESVPANYRELVSRCWSANVKERPTATEALTIIGSMKNPDPIPSAPPDDDPKPVVEAKSQHLLNQVIESGPVYFDANNSKVIPKPAPRPAPRTATLVGTSASSPKYLVKPNYPAPSRPQASLLANRYNKFNSSEVLTEEMLISGQRKKVQINYDMPGSEQFAAAYKLYSCESYYQSAICFAESAALEYPPAFAMLVILNSKIFEFEEEVCHWLEKMKVFSSWFKQQAEAGNPIAQYTLGLLMLYGLGFDFDPIEAIKYLYLAHQAIYSPATNLLGYCFEKGLGVAVDYSKAYNCYYIAMSEDVNALVNVSRCLMEGIGVQIDQTLATNYLNDAEKLGSLKALNLKGKIKEANINSYRGDEFYLAAKLNSAEGCYNVAMLHLKQTTLNSDSISYMRRAASMRFKPAMNELENLMSFSRWRALRLNIHTQAMNEVIREKYFDVNVLADLSKCTVMTKVNFSWKKDTMALRNGEEFLKIDDACCKKGEKIELFKKLANLKYPLAYIRLLNLYDLDQNSEQAFLCVKELIQLQGWFIEECNKGNALALYHVGLLYYYGLGVTLNVAIGIRLIHLASNAGYASAQVYIGGLFDQGFVTCNIKDAISVNKKFAFDLYTKAASQGNSGGQYMLANSYIRGCGVAKDEKLAKKYLEAAVAQNDLDAILWIALCYKDGMVGYKKNIQKAESLYIKAVELDSGQANYQLAELSRVSKNPLDRYMLYRKAALLGYDQAVDKLEELSLKSEMWRYKYYHVRGVFDYFEGDECYQRGLIKKSIQCYKKSAENNFYPAVITLFKIYKNDIKQCDQLKELAIKIEKLHTYFSTDNNDDDLVRYCNALYHCFFIDSQSNTESWIRSLLSPVNYSMSTLLAGYCFEKGLCKVTDAKTAFQCYLMSAQRDNAAAQLIVSTYYECGKAGVKQDSNEALKWLKTSAERRNVQAFVALGLAYQLGKFGLKVDRREAFSLYQKAANFEDAAGYFHLAQCFEMGIGVEIQKGKAAEYYQLAADQGHVEAQSALDLLNGKSSSYSYK